MLTPDQCAVIIINFNNARLTLQCLRAIYEMPDRPRFIMVVDNGSSPADTQELLNGWIIMTKKLGLPAPQLSPSPEAENFFTAFPENIGFGAANNHALKFFLAHFPALKAFWFLNNDTIPQPGALESLCRRISDGCHLAGSTLLNEAGLLQTAAGGTFSPLTGATGFIMSGQTLEQAQKTGSAKVEKKLRYIDGASLLCLKELCQDGNLFTEMLFLYYEDVDVGLRMLERNYKLGWARESLVYHKKGATTGRVNASLDNMILRNRYYCLGHYCRKWLPFHLVSIPLLWLWRLARRKSHGRGFVRAILTGLSGKKFSTRDRP